MTKKHNKVGLALVVATLALVGCGEQQKPAAKSDAKSAAEASKASAAQEVRIGHVGPLTGQIAHLGKDNENGARLAIDEANEAKVQLGGQPVKFTLVAEPEITGMPAWL